ncbi:inositol 1,4,5-trisphosphate receptor-interacting protein [Protopterus annectens]|uniref:inositol 1,4,5-trisphosphate receptor-interacting protein n=1 Tax=Protopterus annectens TaxID=7888 RepID=UPI001CFB2D1C|nr:inositol 1,4,5-trisphosphate receptor-interacting protein [Protopterus annectens]
MQVSFFKTCLVVVTAIVNHPLFFQKENTTLAEQDKEMAKQMEEHEETLKLIMLHLEKDEEAKKSAKVEEEEEEEEKPSWDFWSAVSMAVFLLIEIWRQDLHNGNTQESSNEDDELVAAGNFSHKFPLPDKIVLSSFHERYFHMSSNEFSRTREFVEGFADDLLEALRSECNRETDMELEECIGVGSMYENWRVHKPLMCDLIVPFAPPEPYCFRPIVWFQGKASSTDKAGYGKIRVTKGNEDSSNCACGKTDLGEDMLCLIHSKNDQVKPNDGMEALLCCKNTQYLDANQVMKWFQIAVTKAWNTISRKYDFELTFRSLDSPGALKIKFKSGKFLAFNIIPVVQFEDSDAYFMSHAYSEVLLDENPSSIYWSLSFAVYERRFLKSLTKKLPENSCHLSCLQILSFLHVKQCSLSGSSALSSYHLKTVLMHLLLSQPLTEWRAENIEARLRDMVRYLEKCLQEKRLYHFLIGNKQIPEEVGLPEIFRITEPLNLFRGFVLHRSMYKKTLDTFYEMLKNAAVLIKEYTFHIPSDHIKTLQNTSF